MSNNPTQTPLWKTLTRLAGHTFNLNALFEKDEKRFDNFSCGINGLFIDYSKQRINKEIIDNLISLCEEQGLEDHREHMFSGDIINTTEERAVLHTALRAPKDNTVNVGGNNVVPEIHHTLERIKNISDQIREGKYHGATGKIIKNIVSIGIGGSDLGPRMVFHALTNQSNKNNIDVHFVSNIDGDDISLTLEKCNPEETLFIIISKSFSTQETLTNALTAQKWLQEKLGLETDISNHFIAVASNIKAARNFGIKEENIYPMWDWVNGRFSLWSAVGLPLAIGLGFHTFRELLDGAYEMDNHFKTAPLNENMPVLMALVGIWNRNFLNCSNLAVLPYSERLALLPAYLQQLEMESNGKTIDLQGNKITDYKTNPVLFGAPGTNGQHSFYQLIHQGSDVIPCDFIGAIKLDHNLDNHHRILMDHMIGQGQALMQGRPNPDNPHQYFEGSKPSTTILMDQLDARTLGMLIALYEHKVFVQGIIWNVNSFDQFGVELGKEMTKTLEKNPKSRAHPAIKDLYSRIHKTDK